MRTNIQRLLGACCIGAGVAALSDASVLRQAIAVALLIVAANLYTEAGE